MAYFTKTRNVELSCIDYLTTEIPKSWSNVNVVKSFLKAYDVAVPVVCIRLSDTHSTRQEIGADTMRQEFTLLVDIFAKSDGQRLDLSDYITNVLKLGFPYYIFSHQSGNNEVLEKSQDGRVHLVRFDTNNRVDFFETSEDQDKYRHLITITVSK